MDIAGAIFDCDGTLVDSMSMWVHAYDWLYDHYGVAPVPMEIVEPLALSEACTLFHDEYGMGSSAEEVYEVLCAHVRDGYEHEVTLMPGARDFLEELRAAGVPMIVASSTPKRELRHALVTHGLDGFFSDIVSTEDVGGRDKEFPDVYLEACRRLGSPRETTWVFEDAPFGVRSSRRAGFAVVGLFNDHDGRREEDVRPWCDIFCHGYPELSLALLRDYERPVAAEGSPLRALVIDGSPEPSSPGLVARLADSSDYVICADGGADVCRRAGIVPDVFCGDSDSASDEAAAWAAAAARTCVSFPSEKYATDLALAIDCARHEAARRTAPLSLKVTCASGGRADHALAVVGLLAGAGCASARIVEDAYEMRIVSAEGESRWELGPDAVGRTFSAVAVAPGTRVDERGMRWELEDKPMGLLDDLGISNVVSSPDARIVCREGAVAAYLIGTTKTPQ
ncbi:thiamine diphosphokinase [Thermophilibacter provencensis]|uniref:Thiamine diphosphokinase n=1 Tax=Thermophilibacter provencensis TaxID=1852386 RepID=A0ABT7V1F8_9ACTN|nr:thiamine diphosphokinase [Thermophilibacter provencensis]MDM8270450.1 thiamine diphosphokinase [Thermophilibacter provencensis]